MNLKLLALAMSLCCGTTYAQDTQSYIALNLGLSLPTGDYAGSDLLDDESGFASLGPEISFEGAYFFIDYIGVGGKLGFNMHFFDKKGFEKGMEEVNNKTVQSVDYSLATPYFNFFFQVGPYFNLPVSEKFHITPKVLVGVMSTLSPEVDATVEYTDGDYSYMDAEASTGTSFAPLFGLDFRYVITDRFMMKLSSEYVTFKHTLDDFYGVSVREQNISYLNIMLGAGIAF